METSKLIEHVSFITGFDKGRFNVTESNELTGTVKLTVNTDMGRIIRFKYCDGVIYHYAEGIQDWLELSEESFSQGMKEL
ncbi:TPA: hypothetical protein ACN3ZQ_003561 [Vibrio cholerae]